MIVTLKWLQDYVDLEGVSIEDIEKAFTFSGFEIESYTDLSKNLKNVVVGKITDIKKHENADKLLVCSLFDGKNTYQIVTHATNMKVGDLVPVALVGANLANGVQIKPVNMRGVESCGMMCAGEELGIDNSVYDGAETDGIMILNPKDCSVGEEMAKVLGFDDVIFDVNVLANRPDCQSVIGLAKELSCALNREFKMPNLEFPQTREITPISAESQTENCPYVKVQLVKSVTIKPSPKWMQKRLMLYGIKPINIIVDITNYVLLEMGQPLHAYDLKSIKGDKLIVRQAKKGEEITLLNDKKCILDENHVVIANSEQPIGLAGIMGGGNFSITNETKDIVIESATLKKENIRKTAHHFGLQTDASARYQRGVEPVSCEMGLQRALYLISELQCGAVAGACFTNTNIKFERQVKKFDYNRILSWLGVDIPVDKSIEILNKLDIKTHQEGNNLVCEIPVIRTDIENFSDIAEEIIRFYGFDKMSNTYNNNTQSIAGGYEQIVELEKTVKQLMTISGASEVKTFTLIGDDDVLKLSIDKNDDLFTKQIKISNPLNAYMSVLRTQMLTSMLGAVKYNLNHKNKNFALYEVGKVFVNENDNLTEREILSFITIEKGKDFFSVKSITEMLAEKLGVTFSYSQEKNIGLHPNISANIMIGKQKVGIIGKINPRITNNFEIKDDVFYFEIELKNLPAKKVKKVKEPAKFPSSSRDLAFVVDADIPVGNILEQMRKAGGNICENVELFDVYQSEQLGTNKKSVAFSLTFRRKDATLTQEEVNSQIQTIIDALGQKFDAKLREQ